MERKVRESSATAMHGALVRGIFFHFGENNDEWL